jgi:dTDP-D-glucose 4,6-dehydratase
MLPMYLQNLLRREPLKLVDGGEVQRTFLYIKDAIEAVVLMIVRILCLWLVCLSDVVYCIRGT